MKLSKESEYESIMNDMEEKDFGLDYWTFNIKKEKVPIDKDRLIDSLGYINRHLVSKRKKPFTTSEFKEFLKENEIIYV